MTSKTNNILFDWNAGTSFFQDYTKTLEKALSVLSSQVQSIRLLHYSLTSSLFSSFLFCHALILVSIARNLFYITPSESFSTYFPFSTILVEGCRRTTSQPAEFMLRYVAFGLPIIMLITGSNAFILHHPFDLSHCSSLLLLLSPVQRNSGLIFISFT